MYTTEYEGLLNLENEAALPDTEACPLIFESDNPDYSLEKTADAVAVCARTVFGISTLYPWQRLAIANILDAVHAAEAASQGADMASTATCATAKQHTANSYAVFQPPDILDQRGDSDTVSRDLSELYDEDGVLRGRQIILLPTGAGKSLCFQVPALLLDKPTLIIYPLLALMSDQMRRICEANLEPVIFRGGQSAEEREAQYARLEGSDGKAPAQLIIANPEILTQEAVLSRIAKRGIAHLAIDEAHCVSEWGDSFRPAYLTLKHVIDTLNPPAVTAFTATAGAQVLQRISEVLFDGQAHVVRGESDRTNISYYVRQCRVKPPALLQEVQQHQRPMVIFCATRNGTEQTAAFLRYTLHDTDIRFYHAGLQRDEKTAVEQWFHGHDRAILVTTCAWGMGVDKKNVRTVIHLNASPTAEAYIQEAGRGGRDGSPSQAVLLWSVEDKNRITQLPEKQRKRAEVLAVFAESGRCRREVLLEALGEKRAVPLHAGDESIACSGCDICQGTAQLYPQDEQKLISFISRHKRQYTGMQLIQVLLPYMPLWRAGDLSKLITQLLAEHKIRPAQTLLWKGALTCEEKGDNKMISL
ncbi:MAG: RecQ family ATP-dependent DNA helicase [Treponema sp.]|uniref:RecQ family ATP-dependent DNA helicase n=1 Tax=Treponema sp. TaxID=166 RepID=UPI003FA23981